MPRRALAKSPAPTAMSVSRASSTILFAAEVSECRSLKRRSFISLSPWVGATTRVIPRAAKTDSPSLAGRRPAWSAKGTSVPTPVRRFHLGKIQVNTLRRNPNGILQQFANLLGELVGHVAVESADT